jgi:4-hydroxy-tetrahydrodipicolinate synthase
MFHGSIVALVTPMTEQGELDFRALGALVEFHVRSGTSALVIAGTTGESAALSAEEFDALLSTAIDRAGGRIPIIAGTGSASTRATIARTRRAAELRADAALVVTPYYVRPMQSGLRAHFEAVADASPVPLILYNVPSRTSVDMLPATVESLAGRDNIVAIKEAVADMGRVDELVRLCGERCDILSGDDPSALAAMEHGARGVISVAANTDPVRFAAMVTHALAGEWEEARALDEALQPLYRLLAAETNPIPVKWSVHTLGLIGPTIRLPLLPPEHALRERIDGWIEAAGLRTEAA